MKPLSLLDFLAGKFPDTTRDELYSFILCREVRIDGETAVDPRRRVPADARVEILRRRFVSRGGEKLDHALREWKVEAAGKVFLDAGASTGGFTDCLLQAGAACVHAVDVGWNQLDYRLRMDSRVKVLERTNIMQIASLDPIPDAAVADLSFRSIRGAAGKLLSLTREGWIIALIKPQFELGKAQPPDFAGVIHDRELLKNVLMETFSGLEHEGVWLEALTPSPIPGRKGNREFLALLRGGTGFAFSRDAQFYAAGACEGASGAESPESGIGLTEKMIATAIRDLHRFERRY